MMQAVRSVAMASLIVDAAGHPFFLGAGHPLPVGFPALYQPGRCACVRSRGMMEW
jgi:hypothetical protein